MARESRIEKFSTQKRVLGRQDQKDARELTALGLVDRDGVGELEGRRALVPVQGPTPEGVFEPTLRRELDFEMLWYALKIFALECPDDDSDLAVGDVFDRAVGIDLALSLTLVADVDHLVSIDDPLWSDWSRHLLMPTISSQCSLHRLAAVGTMNVIIQGLDAPVAPPNWREDLPEFGGLPCSAAAISGRMEVNAPIVLVATDGPFKPERIVLLRSEGLLELLRKSVLEFGCSVPPDELDAGALGARSDLIPYHIAFGIVAPVGEPTRKERVQTSFAGLLTLLNPEFGEAFAHRPEILGDVDERSAGAEGGKLSRVTYQDEARHALQAVDRCCELLLSQHRGFVDDHGGMARRLAVGTQEGIGASLRRI